MSPINKRFRYLLTVFTVLAGLAGASCRPTISDFTMERMVAIDDEGGPKLYPYQKGNTVVSAGEYTYEQQLERMAEAIRESGRKKILIFVFGGMNSVDETVEESQRLAQIIYSQSDYYPIFINWESTLFECYLDHLFMIRRGVKSYVFGPALSPFYLTVDLGRAITRLPINMVFQSYKTFASDDDFPNPDKETIKRLRNLRMKVYLGVNNYPGDYSALAKTVYIGALPVRVVSTPIIDTFGKSAWDIMKRRAKTAFIRAHSAEISVDNAMAIALAPPDGAVSLLMEQMRKIYQENPQYEFTLVGHSMGPFIINEIVSRYPGLPYKNIVYLASACSVNDTVLALKPYLEKNSGSTFYNLCIHPQRDSQDMMIYGALPRGSVLEWIDLYFSDPVSAEDLTVGQWDNAAYQLPRLMDSVQGQVVIKAFGLRDPVTNNIKLDMPEQHTDFSNPVLRFWEPAFWQIPKNGSNGSHQVLNGR